MPDEIQNDGFLTLSGGMNLSRRNHRVAGEDQAETLVNATVRRGWAEPRPRFRRRQVFWLHQFAQQAFENGIIQGSARYSSDAGPRIVYAADGRLISFNPESGEADLLRPDGMDRPFLDTVPFVHLQQHGRWLIAQDGVNPPVIVDGDSARLDTDPFSGIPVGCMMASGWNRLVVVAPDRERIFLSDHAMDPGSTPLSFTDDTGYYLNARYFRVPRELGRIVAVDFAPSFNFQDDLGPLVVFCERGTRTYAIQYPREEWIQRDIAVTMLPTTGACAHGASVARENDLLFSDEDGRIQTFKAAASRRETVRIDHVDQPVRELYDRENAALRRWRRAGKFDNRVLTTVWPERIRRPRGWMVRHRGFAVMEEEHLSERPFVWAGLWTGVNPVTIDVIGTQPSPWESIDERCFVVSMDDDKVNRIYELDREPGPDLLPEPRRVPMWIVSRWLDWKAAFDLKRFDSGAMQLGRIRGRVTVQAWWETPERQPEEWFVHEDAGPECVRPDCQAGTISSFFSSGRSRFNLSAPGSGGFHRARPIFRVAGCAPVHEVIFAASQSPGPKGSAVDCRPKEKAVAARKRCAPDYWKFDGDTVPRLPVEICN